MGFIGLRILGLGFIGIRVSSVDPLLVSHVITRSKTCKEPQKWS